jgi:hypothetical protein
MGLFSLLARRGRLGSTALDNDSSNIGLNGEGWFLSQLSRIVDSVFDFGANTRRWASEELRRRLLLCAQTTIRRPPLPTLETRWVPQINIGCYERSLSAIPLRTAS